VNLELNLHNCISEKEDFFHQTESLFSQRSIFSKPLKRVEKVFAAVVVDLTRSFSTFDDEQPIVKKTFFFISFSLKYYLGTVYTNKLSISRKSNFV
jgi:hypothetical protein